MPCTSVPAPAKPPLPQHRDDDLIAQLAAEDSQTDAALREILVERNAEAAHLTGLARAMEERDREIVTLLSQKEKLDRAQVLLRPPPAAATPLPQSRSDLANGASPAAREQDSDLLSHLAAEEARINAVVRRILAERDTEAARLAALARAREERDREVMALLREKKKQDQEIQAFVEGLPRPPAVQAAPVPAGPRATAASGPPAAPKPAVLLSELPSLPEPALERAGFALWRAAAHLREVRERWPADDDLARRLRQVEGLARRLAAEVTERLRAKAERRPLDSSLDPSASDRHALLQIWGRGRAGGRDLACKLPAAFAPESVVREIERS